VVRRLTPFAAAILMFLMACARAPDAGPLAWPPAHKIEMGGWVESGHPFSVGSISVKNETTRPAVLERLSLVGATSGLQVLRVGVPAAGVGFLRSLVPVRPLQGYVVRPHEDALIALGLVVAGDGNFGFDAVKLDYSVGTHQYEAIFHSALRVCAPRSAYPCPTTSSA